MKKSIVFILAFIITLHSYAQEKETLVMITTDFGDIIVKLYNDTPKHRDNFIKHVKNGDYNNNEFHRIIKNFMIQGGSVNGANYTVEAEILNTHFHKRGALAAARRPDNINPERRSSGSQFYIVQGNIFSPKQLARVEKGLHKKLSEEQKKIYSSIGGSPHLDGDYTVFGEVVMGLQIIEKISKVPTSRSDKPFNKVGINMTILE
ncbi:MAG: peptidylprolyl isomerase [Bacteroidota bacterium]|nr:peptidylprolyl isomerase [Bacteroidota bacterium]